MNRREELLERATDHVLEHGLIGLTLRPLAAAIGTSDRMLLYHFDSRDDLVSAVVDRATDRAVAAVGALPPATSVEDAVMALWHAYQHAPLHSCLDVYLQAAATGLLGREPYLSVARQGNARWAAALSDHLVRSGAPQHVAARVVTLVDSALYGFHLDLTTDRPEELDRGVADLAHAAQQVADAR